MTLRLGRTLAAALVLLAPVGRPHAQGPPAPPLIYGGDASFPPFEFLDAHGQPSGFNVALLRLLAGESGARVEFRLRPWSETLSAFERGEVDLVSLAHSDLKQERYDYLAQTWTLHRVLLFQAGRERYPRTLEELNGEVVACEERSQTREALLALPPSLRPRLKTVANQREACRLLARREATAAAGATLTLRHYAAQLGLQDVVEVELPSLPYYLAAKRGRGAELAFLAQALERVRYSDPYHLLVERSLIPPQPQGDWLTHWRSLGALLGLLSVLAAGAALYWNRALRNKVQERTAELQGTLRDRDRLTSALGESEARFRGMVDTLPLGILQHGPDGRVLFANPAALAMLGLSAAALGDGGWEAVMSGAVREDGTPLPAEAEPVRQVRESGRPLRDLVIGIGRSGRERAWLLVSVQPEQGPEGQLRGLLTTFGDVSERKRSQEQIRHLAYHDSLTGLPNRELFLDRLTIGLAHAMRRKAGLAVVFIDLDQFKVINDSLGHTVGDQLLQAVGQRIRAALREEDTVARLGGDEFTALLTGVRDATDASRIASKLQQVVKQPLPIEGRELSVSASIGISLYPSDGEDAESLLKNADTAMYRAKELGRDQFQFYAAAMSQRVLLHLDLEGRLRRALQHDELKLYYQPIVALETGAIEAVEALVRWQDPERGMISPADFIPVAELIGMIGEISAFVMRTACRDQPEIARLSGVPTRVSINISAREFQRGRVVEEVRRLLRETDLAPWLLELEITETIAMQDHANTVDTLQRLKQIGVSLSIDDFGTGYSSLSYLRNFPIDCLKIDRSFVKDIVAEDSRGGIVGAILAIARELGLRVVAEGVETEIQLEFLQRQGCDTAQGYLLARPAPLDRLGEAFLGLSRLWARRAANPRPGS